MGIDMESSDLSVTVMTRDGIMLGSQNGSILYQNRLEG